MILRGSLPAKLNGANIIYTLPLPTIGKRFIIPPKSVSKTREAERRGQF
jgi:hypothetical protein